ncbi:MAG: hypothetical protein A2288_00505 [Candidatus Moranbacteria bacterium RIFOXYA12_FULL_44_15]|nr:MAG: hypothetical protein A2288_00505 [Candidatus Moranbacteria bacterium RIFOXYA12_FULL_44_15]OGI34559.1 MAG: hypothetical protein A2259_05160 [Candidatus Moranbacteria bacterium RIFOXYA2_FULL_43_15]
MGIIKEIKEIAGFAVCRRCDDCGCRTEPKEETDSGVILGCLGCGKEYRFYFEAGLNQSASQSAYA